MPRTAVEALSTGTPQALIGACVGGIFTAVLQARGFLPPGPFVWLAGVAVAGIVAWLPNWALMRAGERSAQLIYAPSGASTAYVPTFSHIDAMEVRGDLEAAERAWAEACAENPRSALVHVKAADFHLRSLNDPVAALALYARVREIPGAHAEHRRYVQAKIIDLHLGPLNDEGRAMVELRRMIDAFPGTREADEARQALAKLKAPRQQG
ncbi:MAG: hypothetical protein K1X31_14605 [Gemmatimonadaceae bacterium]|nr:hypothetical protein [Gemmatimonadaceae bacterium]